MGKRCPARPPVLFGVVVALKGFRPQPFGQGRYFMGVLFLDLGPGCFEQARNPRAPSELVCTLLPSAQFVCDDLILVALTLLRRVRHGSVARRGMIDPERLQKERGKEMGEQGERGEGKGKSEGRVTRMNS